MLSTWIINQRALYPFTSEHYDLRLEMWFILLIPIPQKPMETLTELGQSSGKSMRLGKSKHFEGSYSSWKYCGTIDIKRLRFLLKNYSSFIPKTQVYPSLTGLAIHFMIWWWNSSICCQTGFNCKYIHLQDACHVVGSHLCNIQHTAKGSLAAHYEADYKMKRNVGTSWLQPDIIVGRAPSASCSCWTVGFNLGKGVFSCLNHAYTLHYFTKVSL